MKRRRLRANSAWSRTAEEWCSSRASHKARKPALSINTSAAAIKNAVNVLVPGISLRTWHGAAGNAQEGIVVPVGRSCGRDGLQPSDGTPAMGENEPFAPGDTAEDGLRIRPELQHSDFVHYVEV